MSDVVSLRAWSAGAEASQTSRCAGSNRRWTKCLSVSSSLEYLAVLLSDELEISLAELFKAYNPACRGVVEQGWV